MVRRTLSLMLLALTLAGCSILQSPAPTAPGANNRPAVVTTPTRPAPTARPSSPSQAPTARPASPTQAPSSRPATPTAAPTTAAAAPSRPTSPTSALIAANQSDLAKLGNLPRYTINWNLNPDAATYTGHQDVVYTNTDTVPLTDIVFRVFPNACPLYGCGALTVTAAQVGGQAVTPTSELDNTALQLALPKPLAPGQSTTISMDFNGRVPHNFGTNKQGYGIYNVGDAQHTMMLANAYPVLAVRQPGKWVADPVYDDGDAVYSATALYDVTVTVPGGWTPVATGVKDADSGMDGQRTVHFTSGPTRDFMLALAPGWERVSKQVGSTTLNSYYIGDTKVGGEKALDVAATALETYNRRFGAYPFTELDIVPAPLYRAAGVEYPGLILVEASYYSKPNEPYFEEATAHEVAHQWWYSMVGNDVINSPWLDEALAEYSTAVYYQDRYGDSRYNRMIGSWQRIVDDFVSKGKDDVVGASLQHFQGNDRYGPVVYVKGPLFYDVLRKQIGDDKFFAALRTYYQQYKYGIATPSDLLKIFEQTSGQQLDDLWAKWIDRADGR